MRELLGAVLAALAPTLEVSAGQTVQALGQPTFRAGVEVIEVAVSVTDEDGRPVRELTADDFEIYEDDARQPVVAFTHVDIPVERFDVPLSHPAADAASSAPGEPAGRVYLLLLDDLHTHALRTEEVRAIARDFIENTLLANDVATVALTSGLAPSPPFTSNRRRLLEAVDRFRGLDVRQRLEDEPSRPFGGPTKLLMLRTVERLAGWMGGSDARRKAIILIGQGIDQGASQVSRDGPSEEPPMVVLDAMARASGVAARHDVTLYACTSRWRSPTSSPPPSPSAALRSPRTHRCRPWWPARVPRARFPSPRPPAVSSTRALRWRRSPRSTSAGPVGHGRSK